VCSSGPRSEVRPITATMSNGSIVLWFFFFFAAKMGGELLRRSCRQLVAPASKNQMRRLRKPVCERAFTRTLKCPVLFLGSGVFMSESFA